MQISQVFTKPNTSAFSFQSDANISHIILTHTQTYTEKQHRGFWLQHSLPYSTLSSKNRPQRRFKDMKHIKKNVTATLKTIPLDIFNDNSL